MAGVADGSIIATIITHHISTSAGTGGGSAMLRLQEMGLIRGTVVQFVRSAPLGDPIEIRVRGYRLSLRRQEADAVIIESEGEA